MKKRIAFLAMAAVLAVSIPVYADDYEKSREYFKEYYNVDLPEEADLAAVNQILEALGQAPIDAEEPKEEDLVVAGIRLAGMEELALTYVHPDAPDKAAAVLKDAGMEDIPEEYAPYVACALDLELIGEDDDEVSVWDFLYECAEIGGKGRNYICRVEDDQALSMLQSDQDGFFLFGDEELQKAGDQIVLDGATTGYNIKYTGNSANFLADYTLTYSHDDYTHALQLIGLLKSEDMDAYIQLEPKVSVYEYMSDWGEPRAATPTYEVIQVSDDRYMAYSVEYDLTIEFDSREDKERFHEIIETYAKKYDESFDAEENLIEPLLAGAWWQPLYSSQTEMENEEFGELIDNIVYSADGAYAIHSFSLPEDAEEVAEAVEKAAPELETSQISIYVNPAFMRYITGESHQ